jgi:hypothetical protein
MFSNNNIALVLPNIDDCYFHHQTLSPTYPLSNSHYKSTPNFAFCFDDQVCLYLK